MITMIQCSCKPSSLAVDCRFRFTELRGDVKDSSNSVTSVVA